MHWSFKILSLCVVLGTVQWCHTHPNSGMTQNALAIWDYLGLTWELLVSMARDAISTGLAVKPR